MKKTFIYLFLSSIIYLSSCYKDIGNYDYHDINEIAFQNFDSTNGYKILYGQELNISPELAMTLDQNQVSDRYQYEWSFRIGTADTVIATTKALKWTATMNPGNYSLQYRVTDKSTGVRFQVRTTVQVSTEVYEGYFVLCDVNGAARLDMLAYNSTDQAFTQYTNVLAKQSSTVPMQGKPLQVLAMQHVRMQLSPSDYYSIWLLTDQHTNRINQETFSWNPLLNVRYMMVGDVPQDFVADKIIGVYAGTNASPVMYMYKNGSFYVYSTSAGYAFRYFPVNRYTTSGEAFHAEPFVASDGTLAVMYDADARKFVSMTTSAAATVTDVPAAYNYPTGYDLIHMESNFYPESGQVKAVYSILKDPNTSKHYLLRFNLGAAQNYFEEITAAEFSDAEHFAVSADMQYLFYSVEGRLYEYDLFLKTSKLMLDKGSSVINYLSFVRIFDRHTKPEYITWSKLLNVGSFDPAGPAGSNGTLEQYAIPPVNGQIELQYSWTGLGKITSVAYRNR